MIRCLFFFKFSRAFRRQSDVDGLEPPSLVSIVSSETLEVRAGRTDVEVLDLAVSGEVLETAELWVRGARFGGGGAAPAASTGVAGGLASASRCVTSGGAKVRCDSAPCCTTTKYTYS